MLQQINQHTENAERNEMGWGASKPNDARILRSHPLKNRLRGRGVRVGKPNNKTKSGLYSSILVLVCLGLPRATASEALRMEGSEMALSLTLYRLSGQIFSDGCSVGLARATPPDTRHENSAAQSVRRLFFVDPAYRIWRCFNGRKFVHSIVGD